MWYKFFLPVKSSSNLLIMKEFLGGKHLGMLGGLMFEPTC